MSDKENIPSTPKHGDVVSANSSPVRNSLKPVSPNKSNASYTGKLSFLQNDNIDAHFSHIHNTQDEIQVQLQRLETQTAQTSLDLGHLVDRLKNNNLYLNKLLEGISSKADGITRDDVEDILARIDEAQAVTAAACASSVKGSGEAEAVKTVAAATKAVTAASETAFHSISEVAQRALSAADTASSAATSATSAANTAATAASSAAEAALAAAEATSAAASATTKETSIDYSQLSQKFEEQQQLISRILLKDQTINDLDSKIASLEIKYTQLCELYQNKFNSLANLQSEFQNLQELAREKQDEQASNPQQRKKRLSKLNKFNQLHQLSGQLVANDSANTFEQPRLDQKKRIASTPNKKYFELSEN